MTTSGPLYTQPAEAIPGIGAAYPERQTGEYYCTFGSQYTPRNERHPVYDKAHRDGWVVIEASSYAQARAEVERRLGTRWSMLYGPDGWEPEYFPLGELDRWDARKPLEPSTTYPCWQVRELYDRARTAGAPDSYDDPDHTVHPEHLHSEHNVLMTCPGYVRRDVDLIGGPRW